MQSNGIQENRTHRRGRTPAGVRENPAARARRQAFIAESQRQAIKIASERALKKAYAKFYSTPEGKQFAKEFGKSTTQHAPPHRLGSDTTVDFHDPADLPDSVGCGSHNGHKIVKPGHHPVDDLEPNTDDEISETAEIFGLALRWALDDGEIVNRGWRTIVMISEMRPDLGRGFRFENQIAQEHLRSAVHGANGAFERCGIMFARYLEWMRRAPTVSGIGERLDLTVYVLRPDLLPGNTLAKLGRLVGKTRQAKDKLANCHRDTFSGHKALPMRSDITRDRCMTTERRKPHRTFQ